MKTAKLEQRGNNTGLLVVGGLALLLVLQPDLLGNIFGRANGAAPAPTNGNGTVTGGNVIGQVQGLETTFGNPVDKKPGQLAGVLRVSFDYRGPAQELWFTWGIKPQSTTFFGLLGQDFDNGDHLIQRPFRAWNSLRTKVDGGPFFVRHNLTFPDIQAAIFMPDPDIPQFGRDGAGVGLNFGSTDVWAWISSGAAILSQLDPTDPEASAARAQTSERNILQIISPGNVYNLVRPTEQVAQSLDISFG